MWKIELDNLSLGGYAPRWYGETYPSFGNKNQAGAMQNMDLTNPGYLSQGPGLANLTNGTQANAEFDTLIKGIWDGAVTSDTTYGTGGNKLHKISSTAVTADGTWAHTISHDGSELGEDVAYYKGALYYSYNQAGAVGDIGTYDLSSTFDDDWGSTVPTGKAALQSAPHQMIVGGDDVMYIANGLYVASWDGTTFIPQALDLPDNSEIQSIAWYNDRLWVAATRPNLTGNNKNAASIYVWDGAADSWESEISVMGTIGALYIKNGVLFLWHQDLTSTGGFKLGYVNGNQVTDLANYTGGLPAFYQVTDYKDYLIWASAGLIFAWGSGDKDLPVKIFQIADGGYATVGGLVAPFGTPMVASTESTNFKIAQFSGVDTACNWKSVMFDITSKGKNVGRINEIRINFEKLVDASRVDWKLLDNQGTTVYSDTISFAKLGAKTSAYYPLNGKMTENFRVELDYTNGDTTNSVNIKNIKIYGDTN